jgi:hypothetical protein
MVSPSANKFGTNQWVFCADDSLMEKSAIQPFSPEDFIHQKMFFLVAAILDHITCTLKLGHKVM